jgi:hypothetical protein
MTEEGRAPAVPVSDGERWHIMEFLSTQCAEGRLTQYEAEDRIAAAARALTRADLEPLLADLPAVPPVPATSRRPRGPRAPRGQKAHVALRLHVTTFVLVMAFLVVIWALTGAGYFWPIWPAVAWGLVVALHAAFTRAAAGPSPPRPRR